MLVAKSEQWRKCAGCLKGHPAFILGNGPLLPRNLLPLDGFFTVGVNRIWLPPKDVDWPGDMPWYDPIVVQWTDNEIERDVASRMRNSQAIVFIRDAINYLKKNPLIPYGNSQSPCHHPLASPEFVPATGNMGTAAALWAMTLGCSPVYLLGMSSHYMQKDDGTLTNYYGVNKHHNGPSKRRMENALSELLKLEGVYPVLDYDAMEAVTGALWQLRMGREFYIDTFRRCHASVHLGQQPVAAC